VHEDAAIVDILARPPPEPAVVLEQSKQWVGALMSKLGICPFSLNADKAGLPLGAVALGRRLSA